MDFRLIDKLNGLRAMDDKIATLVFSARRLEETYAETPNATYFFISS